MNSGAWQAIVHGVAKNRTQLSDFHFSCIKRLPVDNPQIFLYQKGFRIYLFIYF